jgi:chemotaxis protein methyltransferase CheR
VTEHASLAELGQLARASSIPLDAYRSSHVRSCVERALARTASPDVAALAARLRRDASARRSFRGCVLVGVTAMFRDAEEFELLERSILPELIRSRERLAVWSAGSSGGDELFSVAELLERLGALRGSLLLGSDVLDEAVAIAAQRVPAGAPIRFERRDLLVEPPPDRLFDLVLCRNVAIYLEPDAQRRLHAKLAAALRRGGYLMLGCSETLLRPGEHGLAPVSRHTFRRAA